MSSLTSRAAGSTTSTPSSSGSTRKWSLQASLKDTDVEELIDWRFHRPLAYLLIRPLEHRGRWITPTHLTMLSMVVGLAGAGACLAPADFQPWSLIVGGLLVLLSVLLDCCDGQLARLRGGGTRFGMMLDGAVDIIVGASVWYALSHVVTNALGTWWAWPACFAVLVSIVFHLALYDRVKNKYLWHVKGERPVPDDTSGGRFAAATQWLYDTVYGTVFTNAGAGVSEPRTADPERYRRLVRGPMRLVSFLGLGTHMFVMYTAAIVLSFSPGMILIAALVIIAGVLNVLSLFALYGLKQAERQALVSANAAA